MSFIWKDENGIFYKSIASRLREAKTRWMVNCLLLLNQLNFVGRHTKVFMQNSSQWCLRNVLRRWIDVDGASHTLSGTAAIFSDVCIVFGFSRFGLSMRMPASFFHFFHKITNIRSWRCFSFSKIRTQFSHTFCNITMIFKVMSQYFPVFGQAYTQPYSFGGRIKLIICQIRHKLRVTLDSGPNKCSVGGICLAREEALSLKERWCSVNQRTCYLTEILNERF